MSVSTLESSTGLTRYIIERGRESRDNFDHIVSKAEVEAKKDKTFDVTESDSNLDRGSECEARSDEEDNGSVESDTEVVQAKDRNKRKRSSTDNLFRDCFSSKKRKLRRDRLCRTHVQQFCHYSPWGGRVDAVKLSKQQVPLEQPDGEYEYETIRSFQ